MPPPPPDCARSFTVAPIAALALQVGDTPRPGLTLCSSHLNRPLKVHQPSKVLRSSLFPKPCCPHPICVFRALSYHLALLASCHSHSLPISFHCAPSLSFPQPCQSLLPLQPRHLPSSSTALAWVTYSTVQPSSQGKPFLCLNMGNGASCSQAGLCLASSYVVIGTLHSCRAIISVPTRKLDNYREKQLAFQSFLLCQVF